MRESVVGKIDTVFMLLCKKTMSAGDISCYMNLKKVTWQRNCEYHALVDHEIDINAQHALVQFDLRLIIRVITGRLQTGTQSYLRKLQKYRLTNPHFLRLFERYNFFRKIFEAFSTILLI